MIILKRVNEKKAFRINISYLICPTIYLYVKEKKMHMGSECFIFIINASLWKTFASHTCVLVNGRFCLRIQKRFFFDNVQI